MYVPGLQAQVPPAQAQWPGRQTSTGAGGGGIVSIRGGGGAVGAMITDWAEAAPANATNAPVAASADTDLAICRAAMLVSSKHGIRETKQSAGDPVAEAAMTFR
jgi:NADPH:quinone reductase-like Zn-dependent oxidoreductase